MEKFEVGGYSFGSQIVMAESASQALEKYKNGCLKYRDYIISGNRMYNPKYPSMSIYAWEYVDLDFYHM